MNTHTAIAEDFPADLKWKPPGRWSKWTPPVELGLRAIAEDTWYLAMDDFSRAILAARFFDSDSTYNNMLALREPIERHGATTSPKAKRYRFQLYTPITIG